MTSGWVADQRETEKSDAAVVQGTSGGTYCVVPDNQSLARRSGTPGMLRWGLLGPSGCVLEGMWKDRCLQEGCTGFAATLLAICRDAGLGPADYFFPYFKIITTQYINC